jgi:hypothetical protein
MTSVFLTHHVNLIGVEAVHVVSVGFHSHVPSVEATLQYIGVTTPSDCAFFYTHIPLV